MALRRFGIARNPPRTLAEGTHLIPPEVGGFEVTGDTQKIAFEYTTKSGTPSKSPMSHLSALFSRGRVASQEAEVFQPNQYYVPPPTRVIAAFLPFAIPMVPHARYYAVPLALSNPIRDVYYHSPLTIFFPECISMSRRAETVFVIAAFDLYFGVRFPIDPYHTKSQALFVRPFVIGFSIRC